MPDLGQGVVYSTRETRLDSASVFLPRSRLKNRGPRALRFTRLIRLSAGIGGLASSRIPKHSAAYPLQTSRKQPKNHKRRLYPTHYPHREAQKKEKIPKRPKSPTAARHATPRDGGPPPMEISSSRELVQDALEKRRLKEVCGWRIALSELGRLSGEGHPRFSPRGYAPGVAESTS